MSRTVIFLGGLGHCAERLAPAYDILKGMGSLAFHLIDVPYPGFEGRPMSSDWPAFLNEIRRQIASLIPSNSPALIYGTGIGAFIAFSFRAHGRFTNIPMVLQGPLIWGIEKRPLSKLLRSMPPLRAALPHVFAIPALATQYETRNFRTPMSPNLRSAFFAGFAHCSALSSLAAWVTPEFLHEMERRCEAQPSSLQDIMVWQGDQDHLASHEEAQWAEEALGVNWSVTAFETWGHYPMIDVPEEWIAALNNALDDLPFTSPE